MNWRDLLLQARAVVFRRRVETELDEELSAHLDLETEKHVARGLSLEEARRRARIEFGAVELAKDQCRDERRVNMIDNFLQDMSYALRGLRRDPMLALAALLTLAIAIGANTTVFSLVDSLILRALPYPDSQQLYWLNGQNSRNQFTVAADYSSLREKNKVFAGVAAYNTNTANWTGVEKPEQLDLADVTPSFFNVLATQPLLGRYLAAGEQGPNAPAVIVLSFAFWRSRLASDPHIVGKKLSLDELPQTVVGVMPQGFDWPRGTQVWRPIPFDEAEQRARLVTKPMYILDVFARLKPAVTQNQLDADLNRLSIVLHNEYPKEYVSFATNKIVTTPLERRVSGDLRPALLVLTGAVALVLLIACVNLANLLLARAAARQRELAVRMALGSGRARIIRQVLTEGLALAVPGGLAGIALAYSLVAGLNTWKPLVLLNSVQIKLNLPVLVFTAGLTLLTGLLFGMAPALAAAGVRIQDALKSASSMQSSSRASSRLRRVLVVAELGVSLVLLIGAGLLARSFLRLSKTELGFRAENLLTLRVNLAGSRYATAASQLRFYDDVLERVKQLPMVRQAAVSNEVPLEGEGLRQEFFFQVAGRAPLPIRLRPQASVSNVSRDFFQTLGIPLRRGRTLDSEVPGESADNIVVNEAFARNIFPGEDPVGRSIVSGRNSEIHQTIVGVVGSIRGSQLGADPVPVIYRCTCPLVAPYLTRMAFSIRTSGDPHAAIAAIQGQIHAVDRDIPVFSVKTMEERLTEALAPQRFNLLLIGTFAAIAIVLAVVGVYGVMSYLVTLRTREIGIRMALGARMEDVLRLVLGESVALAVLAVLAGLGGSWWLTRYLKSMLFGVTPLDGWTFASMPVALAALALAASLAPAFRASCIDPTVALRDE
jgi:putative ABC transport system permease protein